MNERIQELSELADQMADDKIQMQGEYHPDWHDVRDQFFVELIVKEICQVINVECERQDNEGIVNNLGGLNQSRELIKQHFGVKS